MTAPPATTHIQLLRGGADCLNQTEPQMGPFLLKKKASFLSSNKAHNHTSLHFFEQRSPLTQNEFYLLVPVWTFPAI